AGLDEPQPSVVESAKFHVRRMSCPAFEPDQLTYQCVDKPEGPSILGNEFPHGADPNGPARGARGRGDDSAGRAITGRSATVASCSGRPITNAVACRIRRRGAAG